MEINSIGRVFILAGIIFFILGGIFLLGVKVPWLGRLPGDIYVQKKNFTFFFPITTSIFISVMLSIALLLLRRK